MEPTLQIVRQVIAFLLTVLFLPGLPAPAQAPRRAPARPKLVVILVVDQMRGDYVETYGHQWTKGLRRLMDHGAWFRRAAYPYWNTFTCPGHATISTGTFPAKHGMALNAWWDPSLGRPVECTEDGGAKPVSYGAPFRRADSAARLLAPTLADEMRAQLGPATRVVTFSMKQRSAIALAGHGGDAVTWFEGTPASWMTSSYFAPTPVPFVQQFVQANPISADFGKVWKRALPDDAYLFTDDAPGEKPPSYWAATFPHPLRSSSEKPDSTSYSAWRESPFSDIYLGRMAQAAVDSLQLGKGPGTDFLGVGFSAVDYVGHRFGPRSHEVQDTLVWLDATIGALLDHLDRAVGRENYVVALSADHGVAQIPEQMLAEGLDAGRVSSSRLVQGVEKALEPYLGPGPHVARYSYADLYFKPGVYAKLRDNPEAMRAVEKAILAVRGTWRVLRGEDLPARRDSADLAERAAALSYYPGRSGDLIVLAKPNWFPSSSATTHGSGHAYDQRVPLILMGRGIRPGQYLQSATPADIAPTLAFLCGVNLPNADGRVLRQALASAAPKKAAAPSKLSH